MTIYAVDKDQLGIVLADKNIAHAIRHFDEKTGTITILMDKMAVTITLNEVYKLSMHGVKA